MLVEFAEAAHGVLRPGFADDGLLPQRLRDDLGGAVVLRRHEDLDPRPRLKRPPVHFAVDVLEAGDRLRDDEEPAAIGADRLEAAQHERLPAELVELVHQEHDRVRLVGGGQGALQGGDRVGEDETDERRERFDVLDVDDDVERLRLAPERREIEVASARRAIHGRVEPELEPGPADDAHVAVEDLVGLVRHGEEDLGHDRESGWRLRSPGKTVFWPLPRS